MWRIPGTRGGPSPEPHTAGSGPGAAGLGAQGPSQTGSGTGWNRLEPSTQHMWACIWVPRAGKCGKAPAGQLRPAALGAFHGQSPTSSRGWPGLFNPLLCPELPQGQGDQRPRPLASKEKSTTGAVSLEPLTWGPAGLGPGPGTTVEQSVHLCTLQPQAPLGVAKQHTQRVAWAAGGQGCTVSSVQLATSVTAEGGQGARGQAAVCLVAWGLRDRPIG